jgi:hypothetical protein
MGILISVKIKNNNKGRGSGEMRNGILLKIMVLMASCAVLLWSQDLEVVQQFPESSAGNGGNVHLADVNGDGNDDLIARYAYAEEGIVAGIWLFQPSDGLFSDSVDCMINLDYGHDNCYVNAADINDDGFADLVILSGYAADHAPKIVWGRADWPDSIMTPDLECTAPVDEDYQQTGWPASPVVGDWNGDYIPDFAYCDQGTKLSSANYGGRMVIHYGSTTFNGTPDLVVNLEGTDLGIPLSDSSDEVIYLRYFSPFMETGDFNGDGFEDIFAGAYYSSTTILVTSLVTGQEQEVWNSGAGLIFFGGYDFDEVPDIIMVPPNDFLQFTSPVDFMYAGYWTMNIGDFNGDGADDFGLPSWYWGVSMVYEGNLGYQRAPTVLQARILREPSFYFTKDRYNNLGYTDQHGANLFGIGDIDGDGTPDLGNGKNYYGSGPDDNGIRIFLSDPEQTDAITPTFENSDYKTVSSAHLDIDDDGTDEFFATANMDGNLLTLLSYNSGVAVDDEELLPEQYALNQNYPNPFNPSTTLAFNLPMTAKIKISIYDVSGHLVEVLTENQFAAGDHILVWDASERPSGIYLAKLESGRFAQVRKMSLLK